MQTNHRGTNGLPIASLSHNEGMENVEEVSAEHYHHHNRRCRGFRRYRSFFDRLLLVKLGESEKVPPGCGSRSRPFVNSLADSECTLRSIGGQTC